MKKSHDFITSISHEDPEKNPMVNHINIPEISMDLPTMEPISPRDPWVPGVPADEVRRHELRPRLVGDFRVHRKPWDCFRSENRDSKPQDL